MKKWIYGAVRSIANTVIYSYRINPKYIKAVDLNTRTFIVEGMKDIFEYRQDDEDLILKLIGGDEDDQVS